MDDLIFRQAAIKEINRFLGYLDEDMLFRLSTAIKRLPSAQRWISVEERLPENKREKYLILTDGGYECDARWTDNVYGLGQSDRWGWSIFDIPQYSKVTHWMPRMPLPEPPKEEP